MDEIRMSDQFLLRTNVFLVNLRLTPLRFMWKLDIFQNLKKSYVEHRNV
jgi:hypothetical protein